METIHVLVISADITQVDTISTLLKTNPGTSRHYYVESIYDFNTVLRTLVRNTHDVTILDEVLPDFNVTVFDLIQRVIAGGCTSPILILTSLPDEEIEWNADNVGAAGYLNKQIDITERTLKHTLRYATSHFKQLQEMHILLNTIQKQLAKVARKLKI